MSSEEGKAQEEALLDMVNENNADTTTNNNASSRNVGQEIIQLESLQPKSSRRARRRSDVKKVDFIEPWFDREKRQLIFEINYIETWCPRFVYRVGRVAERTLEGCFQVWGIKKLFMSKILLIS